MQVQRVAWYSPSALPVINRSNPFLLGRSFEMNCKPEPVILRWAQNLRNYSPDSVSSMAQANPAAVAAVGFTLEGLHLNRRLNKDRSGSVGG